MRIKAKVLRADGAVRRVSKARGRSHLGTTMDWDLDCNVRVTIPGNQVGDFGGAGFEAWLIAILDALARADLSPRAAERLVQLEWTKLKQEANQRDPKEFAPTITLQLDEAKNSLRNVDLLIRQKDKAVRQATDKLNHLRRGYDRKVEELELLYGQAEEQEATIAELKERLHAFTHEFPDRDGPHERFAMLELDP